MPADTSSTKRRPDRRINFGFTPANSKQAASWSNRIGDQRCSGSSFGEHVVSLILTDSIEANVNLGQAIRRRVPNPSLKKRPALTKSMVDGAACYRVQTGGRRKEEPEEHAFPTTLERTVRVLRMRISASDALGKTGQIGLD